jgi:thymidine kinase
VFKPKRDTRSVGLLSHDKAQREAIVVTDIWQVIRWEELAGTQVLAVDEMHFLDIGPQEIDGITIAANHGCNLIFAGLDNDQTGQPFPSVASLMAIATDLVKLTAVCTSCGEDNAVRSQWMSDLPYNDNTRVGAGEKYAPRCIGCFEPVRRVTYA